LCYALFIIEGVRKIGFKKVGRETRDLTSSKERKGEIQFQNKRKPGLVGLARVRCPCEKLSATC